MRIGVVFPQTEIGADSGRDPRRTRERVEALGFAHLLAYDHVLGADPEVHTPWRGPYDVDTTFHEPFVLFGYLAALDVARAGHRHHHPAAAPDRARRQAGGGGRPAHRAAASGSASASAGTRSSTRRSAQDFATAAAGSSEQIELLRRLWTERSVTHDGAVRPRHRRRARAAAGATTDPVVVRRRVRPGVPAGRARSPTAGSRRCRPGPHLDAARQVVDDAAAAAGRDPARSAWRAASAGPPTAASTSSSTTSGRWRDAGATHLAINTMNAGLGLGRRATSRSCPRPRPPSSSPRSSHPTGFWGVGRMVRTAARPDRGGHEHHDRRSRRRDP